MYSNYIADRECLICQGTRLIGTYWIAPDENDYEPCECVKEVKVDAQ